MNSCCFGLFNDLFTEYCVLICSEINIIILFCSDKATDGSLEGEDWALNMEICDIINETDDG